MSTTYRNLTAWNKSIDLVEAIYSTTRFFPKDEIYGIVNQMRRAAISIPSNIAEGHQRHSTKDFIRFLYIAKGSEAELQTQLTISQRLGYISEEDYCKLISQCNVIGTMIHRLIKSISD